MGHLNDRVHQAVENVRLKRREDLAMGLPLGMSSKEVTKWSISGRRIAWEKYRQKGKSWETPNIDHEPSKSKWMAEENPEEIPQNNSNYHEDGTQQRSLWACCVSIHMCCTLFPPTKYLTCFTNFHLCGNSFLQSWRARALVIDHWSSE